MNKPIFITGIGTAVGKTLVAAIVAEALQADYWKPVQAGFDEGTDSEWVKDHLSNSHTLVHPEIYKFQLAASPHLAARAENKFIALPVIQEALHQKMPVLQERNTCLVIEGAGGILVPLNDTAFVADLIKQLQAKVILVSRNYLGSINHSLMTAMVCRQYELDVLGWIFNDQYLAYEDEIVQWSGFPKIGTVPFCAHPGKQFIADQARLMETVLKKIV